MTVWEFILSIVVAVFASTGFWTLINNIIQKRNRQKDALTRLMLGIAHDRIMELSAKYIDRGYISQDEYEDFFKYYYDPYIELGGNGSAEKIVESQIKKLEIQIKRSE